MKIDTVPTEFQAQAQTQAHAPAMISKEQWYAPTRRPPLDFASPIEAWGFRHYRRWIWLLCKLLPKVGIAIVLKHFYEPRRFPRPDRERELLKQAESFMLDFEGGDLACWRFSPLNGELPTKTALLVHGWEGRAAQMGSLVEPLQRLGYQVYLMDGPAHGDSDGYRSNPTKLARAIERAAQKLQNIDLLVAHSFGAYASMRALQNGLPVQRFVALAGVVDYRNPIRDVRLIFNVPPSAKARFTRAVETELGLSAEQMDVIGAAKTLTTPCLYLHDPQDQDTACFGAVDIAAVLPNGCFQPVPNVGHRSIMWSPETVSAMTTWLKEA